MGSSLPHTGKSPLRVAWAALIAACAAFLGSQTASVALPECSQYDAIGLAAPLAWLVAPLLLSYSETWMLWTAAAAITAAVVVNLLPIRPTLALLLWSLAAFIYGGLAMAAFCPVMSV